METSWSRSVEITDDELTEFVEQENTNTKRKTAYEGELFKNFIHAKPWLALFNISS